MADPDSARSEQHSGKIGIAKPNLMDIIFLVQ